MNLHAIAAPIIGLVNPHRPLTVRVHVGQFENAAGRVQPRYATPGSFIGGIAGGVLTVDQLLSGTLQTGQVIAASGLPPDVRIIDYLSGAGGPGTYMVSAGCPDMVDGSNFTSELVVMGQIQPVGWRDIQMMEGMNLQGTRKKIWLYDRFDGLIRVSDKGGDLIIDEDGNVYLVAMVAEQWDKRVWCSVFATLQDGS